MATDLDNENEFTLESILAEFGKTPEQQAEEKPEAQPEQDDVGRFVQEIQQNIAAVTDETPEREELPGQESLFEAEKAEKSGDIEVEIGNFEDIVNATETDGSGR